MSESAYPTKEELIKQLYMSLMDEFSLSDEETDVMNALSKTRVIQAEFEKWRNG